MLRKLALGAGLAATGCASTPVASPVPPPAVAAIASAAPAQQPAVVQAQATEPAPATPAKPPYVTPRKSDTPLPERLPTDAPPAQSPAVENPGGTLTLASVENLAMASNPTLIQARAQVDGTLGMALQAGLWPNPTLGYIAEKIGSQGTAGELQGGFIQQEIVTARKRRISREKYLARSQAAECVALQQQFRVVNDIRRHYWRTAGNASLVSIREQLLKNAQDRLVTNDELFNVGQATSVQVRQARVMLQRAKLDLQMAQNDLNQSQRELAALVGVELPPGVPSDTLDQQLVPLEWESALAYTVGESPEVRETLAKLQADRITVDRERREPIPNVFVRGAPGYDATQNQTVVNAQLYFSVPIWNRNQGTIREARADLARQQAEVRRVELRLSRDLAMHFQQYKTALQHVETYKAEVLPEAETAYKSRLDAYKQRRETWPNVLDAQSELYMRQIDYVNNLVSLRESRTLIEGFLLTGGLQAPPRPIPPGHIDSVPRPR